MWLCLHQAVTHVFRLKLMPFAIHEIQSVFGFELKSLVHLCVLWPHCRSGSGESSWNLWWFPEAFWHRAWDDKALEGPQYNKADHKEHYDEDQKPLPVPVKTQESQQPVSTTLSSLLSPLRLFCFMLTNVNADAVGYHWVRVAQPLSV